MSAAGISFASRWGGLGVWPDEGIEPGVYPYFDPQGFWDVCLPAVLAMFALGAIFKALETRLMAALEEETDEHEGAKGGRKVTHVFCTGVAARLLLLLLPWAPTRFIRTRWDWACTAPTVYETLAHLYHWRDTSVKLKWSLLGHHAAVLLVVWPLARLTETKPYPISAVSMPLFFEVGSAWSYFSYLAKSRGPRVLDALGMRKMEGQIIPSLIWLCYAGQRVMRAASLWEGIVFLDENPEYARCRALQAVMIALEIHGAWRCFKHLPSMGDVSGHKVAVLRKDGVGNGSNGSNGSSSYSSKTPSPHKSKAKGAARAGPAAAGSPGVSPRHSIA